MGNLYQVLHVDVDVNVEGLKAKAYTAVQYTKNGKTRLGKFTIGFPPLYHN